MKKLLVITGPTSTGKTSLGLRLLKEYSGEIISADSRQVYSGLDYTTNKLSLGRDAGITRKKNYWLKDGSRINGYDLVSVKEDFSVDYFLQFSIPQINKIWQKGGLPIVVGGTGFYLDVLLGNSPYSTVGPNLDLRRKLVGKSLKQLQENLKKVDSLTWSEMQNAERNNPRRLVRYIELARESGSVRAARKYSPFKKLREKSELDVYKIGLTGPRKLLYDRVDSWVDSIVSSEELYSETKFLIDCLPDTEELLAGMIYLPTRKYLSQEIDKQELKTEITSSLHRYVRRQLIWFRKMSEVDWTDISESGWFDSVAEKVRRWYS